MSTIVSIDFRPEVNSLGAPSANQARQLQFQASSLDISIVNPRQTNVAIRATTGVIEPASVLLVKPERALDYKIGAKTAWFDRSLILNVNA